MSDLLTIDEAADYVGMSRSALAQLRYLGRGPRYYAPTPRVIRYRRADIDAWIDASAKGAA